MLTGTHAHAFAGETRAPASRADVRTARPRRTRAESGEIIGFAGGRPQRSIRAIRLPVVDEWPVRQVGYLVGIVLTIAVASHFAFQQSRAGTPGFYLGMAIPTLAIAIAGCVRAWKDGVLREWFRLKAGDLTLGILTAGVLFAGSWAVSKSLKLPHLLWLIRIYDQMGDAASVRKHVGMLTAVVVITAIAEEVVWRGLVVALLEEKVGSRRAWVWAAVLYAVAHIPTIWALKDINAGYNPLIIAAALGAGLVWGFMARRFERLVPGMVSHAFFDVTVMMMFRLWGPGV